ncbi:rod shape-determining protein MreD [uncultured Rikenella sp.]|uniref:rod shape-determining protein MreD n=1 Tax=uncultured Rikenella sp. TaxID=368003 RepID=UPI002614FF9F|nr:rod shape-determining protein MreD [uncultured Rikenella sp.]
MIRFLEYTATFVLLLILQEFVFDNINFGGVVNPYIYIMFLILLPLDIPGWLLLLLGFGAGVAVDFMSGIAGLHAIVSTWLAFVRPTVVGLLLGKDFVYEGGIPTAGRVGAGKFLRYVAAMVLLFDIPFFILEDLSGSVGVIVLRIVLSSAFSVGIIYFLHLPFVHTQLKV